MKNKTPLYIAIILIIAFSLYLFTDNIQKKNEKSNFVPPTAFSILSELPQMISSTSSLSKEENIYVNNTLGLSINLPSKVHLSKELAELHKYELGSGVDKLGQQYKYYEIIFSDSSKKESGASIIITTKEIPYGTITEWLEKDLTRGGNFPEDTVKFEQKNMFGEVVLFGFDDWYKSYSTPEEKRSSEYAYIIKNGLLYKIELHNFSNEERESIWNSIKFNNI